MASQLGMIQIVQRERKSEKENLVRFEREFARPEEQTCPVTGYIENDQ